MTVSLSESPKTAEPFCLQTPEAECGFWLPQPLSLQEFSVFLPSHAAGCILEDISSTLRGPLKWGGRTGPGR